jgi:hypothetical protein
MPNKTLLANLTQCEQDKLHKTYGIKIEILAKYSKIAKNGSKRDNSLIGIKVYFES